MDKNINISFIADVDRSCSNFSNNVASKIPDHRSHYDIQYHSPLLHTGNILTSRCHKNR